MAYHDARIARLAVIFIFVQENLETNVKTFLRSDPTHPNSSERYI